MAINHLVKVVAHTKILINVGSPFVLLPMAEAKFHIFNMP